MINNGSLVNDGLNAGTCANNGQTTWSYNQGVLLDGAAIVTAATGNASVAATAASIAIAAVSGLADAAGVLTEPCGNDCNSNHDSWLFKGIFVRHLGYLVNSTGVTPSQARTLAASLTADLDAMLVNGSCAGAGAGYTPYGLRWDGPCEQRGTATVSAALDLVTAVLTAGPALAGTRSYALVWPALAQGACVDAGGRGMPACEQADVTEAACGAAAGADAQAVAYDFSTACSGTTTCRVRTLGGAGACPPGWSFTAGAATSVTGGDGAALSVCAVRPPAAA